MIPESISLFAVFNALFVREFARFGPLPADFMVMEVRRNVGRIDSNALSRRAVTLGSEK